MTFTVDSQYKTTILQQYKQNLRHFPQKKAQVDHFIFTCGETDGLCLQFLYGSMHPNDLLSFAPEDLYAYVTASLRAWEEIDYAKTIPQPIFFTYVLSHRVNAEWPDCSRGRLLDMLLPYIEGKSMEEAALAVNYWCCSHAAYAPTDGRTLGPAAILRRGFGRCGEESVLTVSALRAVGIPARQVYVPRWSHCNDNHAWVEVWIDGAWHYLGACEPEPVLDKGWFTAAASRAMLVHSRAWTCFPDWNETACRSAVYSLVNNTGLYGRPGFLTVTVTRDGRPVPGIPVEFQLNNYSELFPIHTQETDGNGQVRFTTGRGDLCVSVFADGLLTLRRVDLREEQQISLELRDGLSPDALPAVQSFDLVPPVEASLPACAPVPDSHLQLLKLCEEQRKERQAPWNRPCDDPDFAPYLAAARGNYEELEQFFADPAWEKADKLLILSTLRDKDFVDLRAAVLTDALAAALPCRDRYPADLWQTCVLAPRILDEMLLPQRQALRDLLPDSLSSPAAVLAWMRQELQPVPAYGISNFCPSILGCVEHRRLPEGFFGLAFTAICRALGFPARCSPITARGQWWEDGQWHDLEPSRPLTTLTLRSSEPLAYEERFTLGRWDGSRWVTLLLEGLTVNGEAALSLEPGLYRLVTTTRQIDGTASTRLEHFTLDGPKAVTLLLPPDQTAKRLKAVALTPLLPDGPVREALAGDGPSILLFAQPGAEPTEHLLRELLDCREAFRHSGCPLTVFVPREAGLEDPTLRQVREALNPTVLVLQDPVSEDVLHRAMNVGDLRLPFVLLHNHGRGVYACANYQIGLARTLLTVLSRSRESA